MLNNSSVSTDDSLDGKFWICLVCFIVVNLFIFIYISYIYATYFSVMLLLLSFLT